METKSKRFYELEDRKLGLIREAQSWLRTPVVAHGRAKQGGVDCVSLLAEIYVATGALADYPKDIAYAMDSGPHMDVSKLERMIAETGRFDKVWEREDGTDKKFVDLRPIVRTGDCLCITIGRTAHHVALAIDGNTLIHAMAGPGVTWASLIDPTLARRVHAVYRPMER